MVQMGLAGLARRVAFGEPFGAICRWGRTCEGGALLRVGDLALLTLLGTQGKLERLMAVCLRPREFRIQIFCRTGYCPVKNKENFLLSAQKIIWAGPLGREKLNAQYSSRHLLLKGSGERGSCVAAEARESMAWRRGDLNHST